MFDPALLRSLTGTPLRVECDILPARPLYPASWPGAWSVVRITAHNAGSTGRGEATLRPGTAAHRPTALRSQLDRARPALLHMISPTELPALLPAGPLRSAMDTALWDLLAKRTGQPVWDLVGAERPRPVPLVHTVERGGPETLAGELERSADFDALRVELGARAVEDDLARLTAVRRRRPDAWLMAAADGAWDVDRLRVMLPVLHDHGVRLLEQPLPEAESGVLSTLRRPFPIITRTAYGDDRDVGPLVSRYDGIRLTLDAVGGLTTALRLMEQADQLGLLVLLGSPPATPRSWAAALQAAPGAHYVNYTPGLTLRDGAGPVRPTDGALAPLPAPLWG
ncbi:enolase C-terminal domain-like protein [Streptomyces sp. NPDC016845]|uniref:enolase C-terminal domain-like protein n=1 Tax=Streptomyces sp. NPDC016845 TaxID=3364972 RepID=UPI0037A595D2